MLELALIGLGAVILFMVVFAEKSWYQAVKDTSYGVSMVLGATPKTLVAGKKFLVENHTDYLIRAYKTGNFTERGVKEGYVAGKKWSDDYWDPKISKWEEDAQIKKEEYEEFKKTM